MGTRVAKIDNVEFALGKHVQLRFEGLVEETEVTLGWLISFHLVPWSFCSSVMMLVVITLRMKAEGVRFALGQEGALRVWRVWLLILSLLVVTVEM
jgi:hypothetical protein